MAQNSNLMNLHTLLHPKPVDSFGVRRKDEPTNKGFTLVELIMVMALIGILATMSIPLYNNYTDKAKNAAAIADIGVLSNEVTAFALDRNYNRPLNLSEIGRSINMNTGPTGCLKISMEFYLTKTRLMSSVRVKTAIRQTLVGFRKP
jgi:prepilin-type N-terminal cleavage/methylation domain-containing protein